MLKVVAALIVSAGLYRYVAGHWPIPKSWEYGEDVGGWTKQDKRPVTPRTNGIPEND